MAKPIPFVIAVTCLLSGPALMPSEAIAQDGTAISHEELQPGTLTETFGPFRVERYFVQNRLALPPTPLEVREARLLWSDSEGLVDLRLIDDGTRVTLGVYGTSDDGARCLPRPTLVPPNTEVSTNENWRAFFPWIEREMDLCGLTDPERRQAVLAEAEAALVHYADAGNRWKGFGRDLFGDISRRCVRLGEPVVHGGGMRPYQPCTRWSGE